MKTKKYIIKVTQAAVGVLALGLLAGCVYGPTPGYPGGGYYYTATPSYSSCPYASCYSSQYYYQSYPSSHYSKSYYYPSYYYYGY